jgi:hypothetical protein
MLAQEEAWRDFKNPIRPFPTSTIEDYLELVEQ